MRHELPRLAVRALGQIERNIRPPFSKPAVCIRADEGNRFESCTPRTEWRFVEYISSRAWVGTAVHVDSNRIHRQMLPRYEKKAKPL